MPNGLPLPLAYWPFDGEDVTPPRVVKEAVGGFDGLTATTIHVASSNSVVKDSFAFEPTAHSTIVVPARVNDPLELTTAGTLAVWVYFTHLPSQNRTPMSLVDKSTFGDDLALLADFAGTCASATFDTAATDDHLKFFVGSVEVDSSAVVKAGAWIHVVGTFDVATTDSAAPGVACLYVNGAKQVCQPIGAPRTVGVQSLTFGDGSYFTNRPLDGNLDEVAIWSVALSPEQVSTLYTLGTEQLPIVQH